MLIVGSAYQEFLLIIRYAIFIGYQTSCVRSESEENGKSLKRTWRDQTLDSEVTVWLFPKGFIVVSHREHTVLEKTTISRL